MECHGVPSVQVRGLNQSMTDEQLAKALEELTVENEQREASPEIRQWNPFALQMLPALVQP